MKQISFLLLTFLALSCTKQNAQKNITSGSTDILHSSPGDHVLNYHEPYSDATRCTIWLMYDTSRLTSSRADIAEVYFSDTLSNSIDSKDVQKVADGSDNLAIVENGKTYSKEYRKYPYTWFDTMQLKQWNNTRGSYYLKFNVNNIPKVSYNGSRLQDNFYMFLWDKYLNKYIPLKGGNQTTWYYFDAFDLPNRFSILIKRLY